MAGQAETSEGIPIHFPVWVLASANGLQEGQACRWL